MRAGEGWCGLVLVAGSGSCTRPEPGRHAAVLLSLIACWGTAFIPQASCEAQRCDVGLPPLQVRPTHSAISPGHSAIICKPMSRDIVKQEATVIGVQLMLLSCLVPTRCGTLSLRELVFEVL